MAEIKDKVVTLESLKYVHDSLNGTKVPITRTVNGKELSVDISITADDVGAEAIGTVSTHDAATNSHRDIRKLITELTIRLNTLADSDDATLDQMSELVAYIKSNKNLIEEITTKKVNVSDIIDDLTTSTPAKPLSAAQGVALKGLIDALDNNKIDSSSLELAINAAFAEAKTSGEFDEIYIGDGPMPEGATIQILLDGSAEEQSLKNELKDYINGAVSSIITQGAGESESLVMSQKAVTDFVADALGTGGNTTEYETVDSVDSMTDVSKQYVLSSTGTIWTYGEVTVEKEPQNKFVPSTVTLSSRLSGSSASVSASEGAMGSFVTDFIAVKDMGSVSPYYTRLNWEMPKHDDNKVVFYNSSKSRIGNNTFSITITGDANYTVSNGETVFDLKNMYPTSAVAPSNWADVAYVRFQLFVNNTTTTLTSNDIANLTIKFDADAVSEIEYQWYDTELKPERTNSNYVDILVEIEQNKSDIFEVSNRVTALETGSDSVTIPTFWENAVDTCISKIKALQVGRNCVTFPFFSDNHQRNGYAGVLIAKIMKECHIPYAFFGGDSISSGYIASEAEMIAQDKAFDDAMSYIPNGRFCRAVGNHDGYWAVSASEKHYYTDAQNYELFLREESVAQNKHFGGDGTYYYVDDIASKVRWIVLDTNDSTIEVEQISWLENTALTFTESDWAVVIISHHPIANVYHTALSNAESVINAVKSKNVDIAGWFSGHIHRDRMYTSLYSGGTDTFAGTPTTTELGFTQVTISSDNTSIAYKNDDGTNSATKHPTANDDQSHAIDFVTINKSTRTVKLTRLGIGNDRSYTY